MCDCFAHLSGCITCVWYAIRHTNNLYRAYGCYMFDLFLLPQYVDIILLIMCMIPFSIPSHPSTLILSRERSVVTCNSGFGIATHLHVLDNHARVMSCANTNALPHIHTATQPPNPFRLSPLPSPCSCPERSALALPSWQESHPHR